MKIQFGFAIYSENKKLFLCKDPGIGPMSAPGCPYESAIPNYGIWLDDDKAQKWLDDWKEYTFSYKVVPLSVET